MPWHFGEISKLDEVFKPYPSFTQSIFPFHFGVGSMCYSDLWKPARWISKSNRWISKKEKHGTMLNRCWSSPSASKNMSAFFPFHLSARHLYWDVWLPHRSLLCTSLLYPFTSCPGFLWQSRGKHSLKTPWKTGMQLISSPHITKLFCFWYDLKCLSFKHHYAFCSYDNRPRFLISFPWYYYYYYYTNE